MLRGPCGEHEVLGLEPDTLEPDCVFSSSKVVLIMWMVVVMMMNMMILRHVGSPMTPTASLTNGLLLESEVQLRARSNFSRIQDSSSSSMAIKQALWC